MSKPLIHEVWGDILDLNSSSTETELSHRRKSELTFGFDLRLRGLKVK